MLVAVASQYVRVSSLESTETLNRTIALTMSSLQALPHAPSAGAHGRSPLLCEFIRWVWFQRKPADAGRYQHHGDPKVKLRTRDFCGTARPVGQDERAHSARLGGYAAPGGRPGGRFTTE